MTNPGRTTCSSDAITEWFCFVTGFTQREGGATPFEKLHRRVQKHAGGPDYIVEKNGAKYLRVNDTLGIKLESIE